MWLGRVKKQVVQLLSIPLRNSNNKQKKFRTDNFKYRDLPMNGSPIKGMNINNDLLIMLKGYIFLLDKSTIIRIGSFFISK